MNPATSLRAWALVAKRRRDGPTTRHERSLSSLSYSPRSSMPISPSAQAGPPLVREPTRSSIRLRPHLARHLQYLKTTETAANRMASHATTRSNTNGSPVTCSTRRFRSADFTDHNAIGTEAKRVPKQRSQRDLPRTFSIRWPGLQADYVPAKSQFGGVFDGDGTFLRVDLFGENVQERGLSRAGSTGDQQVQVVRHRRSEQLSAGAGHTTNLDKAIKVDHGFGESADRNDRSVDRGRWNHGVQARSVREPSIDSRTRAVDAQSQRSDDSFDGSNNGTIVGEDDPGAFQFSAAFDPHLGRPVDEHIGPLLIPEQTFDGAETGESVDRIDDRLRSRERRHIGCNRCGGSRQGAAFERHVGFQETPDDPVGHTHGCSHTRPHARIQRSPGCGILPVSNAPIVPA